jgi:hypothetical protein
VAFLYLNDFVCCDRAVSKIGNCVTVGFTLQGNLAFQALYCNSDIEKNPSAHLPIILWKFALKHNFNSRK